MQWSTDLIWLNSYCGNNVYWASHVFQRLCWSFHMFYIYSSLAPHSSTLAWKIPWTEEPGGLQSMGSWRVRPTEWLHFHFSLSCIGEGNGNPLQCSCLENPRDGGAWLAAVYGVAQSRTRLKRLSSSSSIASLVAQMVKNLPAMQETCVQFLGQEDPLEKGMATHSSILAWRISWTKDPGRLSP